MADDVVLRISTDEAKVLEGIRKVMEAQNKMGESAKRSSTEARAAIEAEKAARRTAAKLVEDSVNAQVRGAERARRAQADLNEEMDNTGTKGSMVAGSFTSMVTKLGAFVAAAASIKEVVEHLDALNEKANEAGRAMLGAAMQQDPGKWGEIRKEIEAIAAAHGQLKDQASYNAAFDTFASIQALNEGDSASALQDFKSAMAAAETGMNPNDLLNLIGAHRLKGGTGTEAVAQLYKAAELSVLKPEKFAPVAAQTVNYSSTSEGLAAAVALKAAGTTSEMLPTATKDLQLAIVRMSEDKKFSDVRDMTESDAVLAIRERFQQQAIAKARKTGADPRKVYEDITDIRALQKYTEDEGKATALNRGLLNADLFESAQAKIQSASLGIVSEKLQQAMGEDPQIAEAITTGRAASANRLSVTSGTDSGVARSWAERQRGYAETIRQSDREGKFGASALLNEETGGLSILGKGVTAMPMIASKIWAPLIDALRENTEETRRNSQATTQQSPESKTQRTPARNSANN